MHIIVGLGNPGEKYKNTRHNAGFLALNFFAEEKGLNWQFNKKFNAEIIKTDDAILIKPQTFMNNSGQAVRAVMDFYKLLPKKLGVFAKKDADLSDVLTIVHDDIDFELGVFKAQKNRSAGGHNGINSIINHLKTKNFTRVRIGIAKQGIRLPAGSRIPKQMSLDKFVLDNFSSEEKIKLKKMMPEIIKNTL
ncbi:MAG: aminoacyl-tRNA hydrolase [Patescibacteria group bacterium]|jgi:PTH1 family peptidyl-tRNA hydrolase